MAEPARKTTIVETEAEPKPEPARKETTIVETEPKPADREDES